MKGLASLRYAPKPLLALLIAALLSPILYTLVLSNTGGESGGSHGFVYPDQLPGGYRVAAAVTGAQAANMSAGIHWNPGRVRSEIRDAAIIVYEDGTRLWLAYTGDNACSLVNRMAEKIAAHEQELPYSKPFKHTINGTTMYFTVKQLPNGVQQLHVFWCKDGIVAWAEIGAAGSTPQNLARLLSTLVNSINYSG